jgi:hypothetical protein
MKRVAVAIATLAIAAPLFAQLASDEVPRQRTLPRSEQIANQLTDSRWELGAIRLQPIFGLHNTGYTDNVFGTVDNPISDWRATVSAGVNMLLPMGRKMYVTGIANPEYTWYDRVESRRMMGGKYGGSLLGLYNHLSFEAGASTEKTMLPVNSEVETPTPGRQTDYIASTEVDIVQRLSLFGSAHDQQHRYFETADAANLNPEQLERDETYYRGGFRYKPRSYFDVSIAAETGRAEFVTATQNNNSTQAILLGIHYDRPRMFLNLNGGSRHIEPRGAQSTFPTTTGPTGSYFLEYQLAAPIELDAYGHIGLVYSLFTSSPYFDESRNGLGATWLFGHRLGLRVYGERGSNRYPDIAGQPLRRNDDIDEFGGALGFRFYRNAAVTFTASQTRYSSNVDAFDRSVFHLDAMVSLTGNMF